MGRKIIGILAAVALAILFIIATMYGLHQEEPREVTVEMSLSPTTFLIQENSSQEITLQLRVNDEPQRVPITWSVKSNGTTGGILSKNSSLTDGNGRLTVIYYSPEDIDALEQRVTIVAAALIDGTSYQATAEATVYPLLYPTMITVEKERERIISGEMNMLRAQLYAEQGSDWLPLGGAPVVWHFFVGDAEIMERESTTDSRGIATLPFFYSNMDVNATVRAEAVYEQNLSGERDYDGCSASLSFEMMPEKPGDFPVVLIHGWSGSISDALINYTWWNLTKKLQAHHFTVLDFDVTKPGIQWLTYQPEWFEEHHIPWIAARVCEDIQEALVMNGYPPNQTIDIVAHSMGGLVSRFMAEQYGADTDYWNKSWNGTGKPWYGDGDADITVGPFQIDDLIAVGTPCHGVPPNINESFLRKIIKYAYFPWWSGQVADMVYGAPFLSAMGYRGTDLVDYYGVGGDIGIIFGDTPVDFDGDGIPHYSDGLVPAESPYLEGKPFLLLEGKAWPLGEEDHISLIAINDQVHDYILEHLID